MNMEEFTPANLKEREQQMRASAEQILKDNNAVACVVLVTYADSTKIYGENGNDGKTLTPMSFVLKGDTIQVASMMTFMDDQVQQRYPDLLQARLKMRLERALGR